MNVDKNETIAGMWATPKIPQVGTYKLVAKKRVDGMYEWVHFQHRLDDTRKVLFRGEVESEEKLAVVVDAANKHLQKIYGVSLLVADASMKTLDGRKGDSKVH